MTQLVRGGRRGARAGLVAGVAVAASALLAAAFSGCNASAATASSGEQPRAKKTTRTLFVSVSGSDAGACSQVAPCASFGRAYQQAACGATVAVAAGSYPLQAIAYDASKESCNSSSRVSFVPQSGTVTLAGLNFGAEGTNGPKHILVRDMVSTGLVQMFPASDDIYLQNLTALSAEVDGASDVTVKGGTLGPCEQSASQQQCSFVIADDVGANNVRYNPSNILVDGVTIHGFNSADPATYHPECLFIVAGGPITIENSKIYQCQTFGLFAQDYNSGYAGNVPPHDVTLLNNWWGMAYNDAAYSQPRTTVIELDPRSGGSFTNWTVAFNSMYATTTDTDAGGLVDLAPASTPGLTIKGNLMQNQGCIAGATYSYNLLVAFSSGAAYNTTCGTGDVIQPSSAANFGYLNPADLPSGDWHLGATSPAIGLVPASAGCPTTDIDGDPRTGSSCDAGADQH